jgi:putative ABC transport system ATP-binding protein
MNTPLPAARSISRSCGRATMRLDALNGVALQIGAGESLAVVGKGGSGKSTLMHLLALLDQPDGGAVLVGGKDAADCSSGRCGIHQPRGNQL